MNTDVVPLHYLMKESHLVEDNIQNQDLQNIEINHKEKIISKSNGAWMCKDEFVINSMILEVFIEFFEVKIVIRLSKNHCDLILTVRFDFGSNIIVGSIRNQSKPLDQASNLKSTIGSSYIRWKSI